MPAANLANIPSDQNTLNEWTFSLQAQIRAINRAIYQDPSYQIALPEYSIDPLNLDQPWVQLQQFQTMTDYYSEILNIPGYNFEDVDLTDAGERASWVWLVFTFMKQASDQLGVG